MTPSTAPSAPVHAATPSAASSAPIAPIAPIASIGVVVPAHDEERLIGACLESIAAAAETLDGVSVHVIVVCDACTDRTAEIVRSLGHTALPFDGRNVGRARSLGAEAALARGADWLAFTDADTVVCRRWLASQIALQSDVVCGTIGVEDWDVYGDAMRLHFERTYTDRDGHRHIHGANLGISALAYRSVGGFESLANSEDVAIVRALEAAGARIAWSAAPRVVTSARASYRATAGFGATLATVATAARMLVRPVHDASSTATAPDVPAEPFTRRLPASSRRELRDGGSAGRAPGPRPRSAAGRRC